MGMLHAGMCGDAALRNGRLSLQSHCCYECPLVDAHARAEPSIQIRLPSYVSVEVSSSSRQRGGQPSSLSNVSTRGHPKINASERCTTLPQRTCTVTGAGSWVDQKAGAARDEESLGIWAKIARCPGCICTSSINILNRLIVSSALSRNGRLDGVGWEPRLAC